ncbi:MAG: MBL fold metallo-hydrolase, partial [Chloroflexota bacterium]
MQLTWLGAAGFKVDTSEGATFLIDPFFSRPPEATPPLPINLSDLGPVDEILLTHGRFDHAMDTPALVEHTGAIVHAHPSVCNHLKHIGISDHNLEPTVLNKTKRIGSLIWQPLAGAISQADSSHTLRALLNQTQLLSDMHQLDHRWPLQGIVSYSFKADGIMMAHFGSAGWVDSVVNNLRLDIALLPVERPSHISTAVINLAKRLRPKVIIPHHWDSYYPQIGRA